MKKRIILIFLLTLTLSLSARPQFFVGGGALWQKIYATESMKEALSDNDDYFNGKFSYIATLFPSLEFTFIPYTGFPLGVTAAFGYGFVSGVNTGVTTYRYNEQLKNSDYYRYGADDVLTFSGGLTYIHLADSEKYFSVSGSVRYTYQRYALATKALDKGKRNIRKERTLINEHILSLGLGIMGRYDASYFRVEALLGKDLDKMTGVEEIFRSDSYSLTVSCTFGCVFTILNQHQFMR